MLVAEFLVKVPSVLVFGSRCLYVFGYLPEYLLCLCPLPDTAPTFSPVRVQKTLNGLRVWKKRHGQDTG